MQTGLSSAAPFAKCCRQDCNLIVTPPSRWLEEMPGHIVRDLLADLGSLLGRVSVVHAGVDASIEHFAKRLREATEGARGICQSGDLAVYCKVKAIRSEEVSQSVSRSAAEAAVRRRVLRMIGRNHQ